ncbi:type II secretion system secretin GspD [Novosphingobium sp. PASSN1]|uniref:type II secretion system secretin GspD n=1 Tax=Novosphingobium sp. PASSN1 TaxID=2015561 RepID=UPI0025CF1B99|nr:type II secretion system secretin GspD [Novosphingobium sp. PASSN1]
MNKHQTILLAGLSVLALAATAGCAPNAAVQPVERAQPAAPPAAMPRPEGVTTALIGGTEPAPALPGSNSAESTRSAPKGNIEFTIPSADVRTLAQIVLRDTLRIPYTVSLDGDIDVGLTTAGPVNRQQLLDLFEASLKKANLVMVWEGTGYRILTLDAAKARGTEFVPDRGFGSETVRLQFANAEELKKLLDSVVPGAVQSIDPTQNALVIAGTQAQRKSAHDLIAQFDVNWLRSMSFALYVPQNLDSRLIVPELDKLINAPDAPTRGLVRLIGMERINGVIAISAQKQYLEDVRRWVEVLDREGTNNEARLYIYRVQNSRSRDLVKTINTSFGFGGGSGSGTTGGASENADPFASDARGGTDGAQGQNTARQVPAPGQNAGLGGGGSGGGGPDTGGGGLKVRVSSDEINNAVVVYGNAHDYAIVEDALRKLDVPPLQVMIEAAITEVGLNDGLRYGVQWNFATGQSNFALTEGSTANPTRVFPGFSYFYSNNNDIRATLNALEERTTVKVVSAPKLMVLNNQTAALQVGDQVPVLSQQVTPLGGGSSTGNLLAANSVEYRDTGVILKITPRVNVSGAVLLDVSQEVSDVQPTKTGVSNSPTISTRRVATTVSVQDGQVIALGGLFRDNKSFGKNGLPILSRIPILGGLLFGNNNNTQKRTELIILIKPHVLRTPDDLTAITEELRAKIQSVEPFKTKGKIP